MSALAGIVERYAERDSPLHRADARVKLAAAVLYIGVVAATAEGAFAVLALLALPPIALVPVSRLGVALVLRRTILAFPFVLAAVPLLVTRPGEVVATVPLLGWGVREEGVIAVASIMARSWVSVLVAVLLVASTSMIALLRAMQSLRMPRLLLATVFFTYRYIHVVGDEATRMMRARDSRSAAMPGLRAGRSIRWRAGVLGHMVGSLFMRSLDRSERVHAAMQARGFDGRYRALHAPALRGAEVAAAASLVAWAIAVQLWGRFA